MKNTSNVLIQEGRKEGREEGRKEGRKEGRQDRSKEVQTHFQRLMKLTVL